jgi:hypothetical protein
MRPNETTNIRIAKTTRNELNGLGCYGENANDILMRLIDLWKSCKDPAVEVEAYRKSLAIQKTKIVEPSIFDGEK